MSTKRKRPLSKEQRAILREGHTEPPLSGKFLTNKETGEYSCAYCGNALFQSKEKFDSGCGWPAFSSAISGAVKLRPDKSHGLDRIEAACSLCGSHLGHVFDDGPKPSGKRYCINSLSLGFSKTKRAGRRKQRAP